MFPALRVAQPILAVRYCLEESVRLYSQLAKNSTATTFLAAKFRVLHHSLDHLAHHTPHPTPRILSAPRSHLFPPARAAENPRVTETPRLLPAPAQSP